VTGGHAPAVKFRATAAGPLPDGLGDSQQEKLGSAQGYRDVHDLFLVVEPGRSLGRLRSTV
jgi:hypothetical protein